MSHETVVRLLEISGRTFEVVGVFLVAWSLRRTWERSAGAEKFLPMWLRRVLRRHQDTHVVAPSADVTMTAHLGVTVTGTASGSVDLEDRLTEIERRATDLDWAVKSDFAKVRADMDRLRAEILSANARTETVRTEIEARQAQRETVDVRTAVPGLLCTMCGLLLELAAAVMA